MTMNTKDVVLQDSTRTADSVTLVEITSDTTRTSQQSAMMEQMVEDPNIARTDNQDKDSQNTNSDFKTTIHSLKKELKAANEIIIVLQKEAGNENFGDTDKLSEKAKGLVMSGQLTLSSMYSVMRDMAGELTTKEEENKSIKKQLMDAYVDLSKLIMIESELKKLNSNMEALAEERIGDIVTIDDIERRANIVAKLKEGVETVEKEMVDAHFEVRIFILDFFIFVWLTLRELFCSCVPVPVIKQKLIKEPTSLMY